MTASDDDAIAVRGGAAGLAQDARVMGELVVDEVDDGTARQRDGWFGYGRVAAAVDHHGLPVSRPYSSRSTCDLALPVERRVGRGEDPLAPRGRRLRRLARATAGRRRRSRPGRSGPRAGRQPVSRTIGAMPGRSLATTGTPAAIASNSLFGVVSRWLSVVGWIGIATTSARGDPVEELGRAGRPAGCGRGRRCAGSAARRLELGLSDAVAHQDEDGLGDRRDRLEQLLDAASRREAALVEDDPGRRVQSEDARGSGAAADRAAVVRYEQFITIERQRAPRSARP